MKELIGTSAFVTGAVSGIGLGIATALVLAGRKIVLANAHEVVLAGLDTLQQPADASVSRDEVGIHQIRDGTPTP